MLLTYSIKSYLFFDYLVMAKRLKAVGKMKKTHSRKTKKRLAIKKTMLAAKAAKRKGKK